MNLATYLQQRHELATSHRSIRVLCVNCLQPEFACYCAHIRKFDPQIEFAILIHPLEFKRRIATGRMSHLCLEHSHLLMGCDFSQDIRVNTLLANPALHCAILYPGRGSANFTPMSYRERAAFFPSRKKLVIFVIDGTWNTARKMLRLSHNLHGLPRFCFSPQQPSHFRVRKQPKPECYSTIEAIHHTVELVGPGQGFDLATGQHNILLKVFGCLVEQQLEFMRRSPSRVRYKSRAKPARS